MDCAPLNLAHFHERRAEKFLRNNRYEDANAALQTSLFYLQDAFNHVQIPKSIEILNTQKWDYERKLRQIQIRKQQHERPKFRDLDTSNVPSSSLSAQSVSKSIDKTIKDFDEKYHSQYVESTSTSSRKENQEPWNIKVPTNKGRMSRNNSAKLQKRIKSNNNNNNNDDDNNGDVGSNDGNEIENDIDEYESIPPLPPLQLPAFDFNVFTTSTPSLSHIAGLDDVFTNME